MASAPRRPGPESTLADVREQLVTTAVQQLLDSGIELGMTRVTLSSTIAASDVPRATAYRSLADSDRSPQEQLHYLVLEQVLNRHQRAESSAIVSAVVLEELERNADSYRSDNVAERSRALRSLIRVGAARSYFGVRAAKERSILIAAYGAIDSQAQGTTSTAHSGAIDWQQAALLHGEEQLVSTFGDLYTGFAELFEQRLRPSFTIGQFSTAAAALVEGLTIRATVSPHVAEFTRPTGEAGADETWTLYATAFEGLFLVFFEPINPDDPFADLSRY